jgi:predicted metal-dependent peptidase
LRKIDKLTVVYWDEGVKATEELKSGGEIQFKGKGDFKGFGGGTEFYPVSKFITKDLGKINSVIVFTDGYIDYNQLKISPPPPWSKKTLWIVTKGNGNKTFLLDPPYGKAIEYDI